MRQTSENIHREIRSLNKSHKSVSIFDHDHPLPTTPIPYSHLWIQNKSVIPDWKFHTCKEIAVVDLIEHASSILPLIAAASPPGGSRKCQLVNGTETASKGCWGLGGEWTTTRSCHCNHSESNIIGSGWYCLPGANYPIPTRAPISGECLHPFDRCETPPGTSSLARTGSLQVVPGLRRYQSPEYAMLPLE